MKHTYHPTKWGRRSDPNRPGSANVAYFHSSVVKAAAPVTAEQVGLVALMAYWQWKEEPAQEVEPVELVHPPRPRLVDAAAYWQSFVADSAAVAAAEAEFPVAVLVERGPFLAEA